MLHATFSFQCHSYEMLLQKRQNEGRLSWSEVTVIGREMGHHQKHCVEGSELIDIKYTIDEDRNKGNRQLLSYGVPGDKIWVN